MTTVGLELTNFIDPTLTWKTVSKGRNRRSRRADSKTLKMNQGQEKRNAKRLNEAQSSESDKSDVSIRGRGFAGNLEHIPIKKRRFLLRSPSPPSQPLNYNELESSQCNLGQGTFTDGNKGPQVTAGLSEAPDFRKVASIDNIERTVGCFNEASASGEDFSGIAILAAAACSGGLDSIVGDVGKSKIGGALRREDSESIASAPKMKETVGVDICQKVESGCLTNNVESVGGGQINGLAKTEPEDFAFASGRNGSIECHGPCNSLKVDVPHVDESSDFPSAKGAHKALESSGASRDYRLHWDLNTVMDEWDHPLDETADPGMQSFEVAPAHCVNSQNTEKEKSPEPPENSVVIASGNSPGCTDFTGLFSVHNKSSSSAESSINVKSKSEQDVDVDAGNSLSLGFHSKAHTLCTSESQLAHQHLHETEFSLVNPTGNATCVVRDAESEQLVDFKETKVLEACEYNGAALNSSVPTKFVGGDKCGIAIDTSITGTVSSKVTDTKCEKLESVELLNPANAIDIKLAESVIRSAESQPSVSDISKVGLKVAVGSQCPTQLEDMVAPSATVVNCQVMDAIPAEIRDKSSVPDASSRDNPIGVNLSVPEAVLADGSTVDPSKQSGYNNPDDPVDGVCDSHVSNKESSQVTEDATNVPDTVGGYDSLLEDGELRESVGHCWEINEGEDDETECVDYDSDGREDVFFEDANDFVQLSGEVLAGECGKQSCRSDNFSSADIANPEKILEENCSLRHQGSSSAACAREAECTNRESPVLKACLSIQHKGETISDRVEVDFKNCRGSDFEAVSLGKECDNVQSCARGASLSGRELQVPDRMDCTRRSRSSNLDSIRPDEGSCESLARRQSSLRTDCFGGQSCNGELRSAVEDGEGVIRVSGDTSPRARRACIIPTTRSGYQPIRRGSPGNRDSNYGSEAAKVRDFSPENNSRSRFDRFSNGINRGLRDGYRRSGMYDGGKSTGAMLNDYGKRERSYSPFDSRIDSCFPRSYRKSRSRSRTRSPDFRSEARMGRPRFGYPSAGHTADHMRERRSPVRVFNQRPRFDTVGSAGRLRSDGCTRPMMRPVRFHDTSTSGRDHEYDESDDYRRKPPFLRSRRSRSRSRSCSPDFRSDGRMSAKRPPYQPSSDFIRGRRSPVRGFRPGQRYDNGGSPGRLRSDDGMRPMMRPRFGNTATGRGQDFNSGGEEYRGKPRNIFERIHPRNYEADGNVRRLQYDEQDNMRNQNFRRNDNYVRGGDGRPTTDGFRRDDRGNARYNSDRMFCPAPKQFGGIRDYADDSLPRGVRP